MYQQKARLALSGETAGHPSASEPHQQAWQQETFNRRGVVPKVVAELVSGSACGVMIVGDQGAGKSFVAQRALEQLHKDYVIVQVRGSSVSSTLQYGALSVLLNELDGAQLQHPLMVLRGLTQLLAKKAQGRKTILFVDNAHDLDDLSSMVIAQLCAGGHVRLLVACRELPNSGGDIMGLWKDDLLRRVDLGPLTPSESAAILRREFKGPFSETASRALWSASAGNVLYLLTLAKEQIRQGIISAHEGVWLLSDSPLAFTGEVRDVARSRLKQLSPGQRDVYELLALAGSVKLSTLMKATEPEDMDSLQETSIIEISQSQPPHVRIADAVTAGIVASVVPPGRSAELRRRLAKVAKDEWPEEAPEGGSDLTVGDWARVQMLLDEAEVASTKGRHSEVAALLGDPDTSNLSDEPKLMAASILCASMAALGDVPGAVALAEQIELAAHISRFSDQTVRKARATLLQTLLLAGEMAKCEALLARMLASSESPERLGDIAEIVPGLLALHRGGVEESMSLLEAGVRQISLYDQDGLAGLAIASSAYAASVKGDEAKATRMLAELGLQATGAAWLTAQLTRLYELRTRVELRDSEGLEGLLEEAGRNVDASAVVPALQFLSAAVGSGGPSVGGKLVPLALAARGSFAELCVRLGEGLTQRDSHLLLSVSQEAQKIGNAVLARQVARQAVDIAGSSGDRMSIRVAQRAQQALEAVFQRSTSDPITLSIAVLTSREYEVAKAATAGISNRKIAEQMHVSVRTVEGHLYQVYAKLHVASRAELKDVLGSQ